MMPVSTQPTALIVSRRRQPWLLVRSQWRTMPACEIVKSMNTPTAYSGISAWVEAPPAMTTAPATEPSRMIPVREREAVAAERELAGDEPVLGQDGGQPRERGERGVGGEEQQQRRERLEQVEPDAAVAVDVARDLGDDRRPRLLDRHDVEAGREERDAR